MVTAERPASRVGHITLGGKQTGKPIAGNRHDGFEVAGAGTQLTVRLMRHSQRKRGATARRNLRSMALALDPTSRPMCRPLLVAIHLICSLVLTNRGFHDEAISSVRSDLSSVWFAVGSGGRREGRTAPPELRHCREGNSRHPRQYPAGPPQ